MLDGVAWFSFPLAVFATLLVLPTTATAQFPRPAPLFVQPATTWGGQIVPERVPYQPSAVFVAPTGSGTPFGLHTTDAEEAPCVECVPTEGVVFVNQGQFAQPPPQLPPGTRSGVFQKAYLTGTWLPQLDSDSLGWGDVEMGVVLGFPFFRRDTPLVVTPQFGVHFLERPIGTDLPDRVYDAAMEFRHLRRFGSGPWAMDAAVTIGSYSDFEVDHKDAFRVTGRALGVYEGTPGTKWVFGVVYVNRAGISVLPAAGVIHEADPDVKWELIFPRPRVAWRLPGGIPGSGDERWFYVRGEFGGGVWAIQHPASLLLDKINYNDLRVLVGYERKIAGGFSRRFEIGYVFGRELEFDSTTPDLRLDDTLLARVGMTY